MLGALSVRLVGWADWVDCRCFLFFVFLGVARRLELSPCNTQTTPTSRTQELPTTTNTGGGGNALMVTALSAYTLTYVSTV